MLPALTGSDTSAKVSGPSANVLCPTASCSESLSSSLGGADGVSTNSAAAAGGFPSALFVRLASLSPGLADFDCTVGGLVSVRLGEAADRLRAAADT